MKTILVHMLAFSEKENEFRPVDVPENRLSGDLEHDLDVVFELGQNDFQPKPHCSVSCGDVIIWEDGYYAVCRPFGFRKLTPEEYTAYKSESRRDRLFSKLIDNYVRKHENANASAT